MKGILPSEEGGDRDLVGGVEHAGRGSARLAASRARRRQGTSPRSGASKVSSPSGGEVELGHGDVGPLGEVQRVGDRHPHVGIAQVGERGAVVEVDQRVDDRLRVDDDVDALVGNAE